MESPSPLRQALAACKGIFAAVGLVSLGVNVLMLTVPLYAFQIFDRVLASRSLDTLLMLSIAAVVALLLLSILDLLRSQLLTRLGMYLDGTLSSTLFEASVASAMRSNSRGIQGLHDLSTLRSFLSGPGATAVFDAPIVPVYVFVIFAIHPLLGWIALGGAIALFLIAVANLVATRRPLTSGNTAVVAALNRAHAQLRNADAIEAMGMMKNLQARWQHENGSIMRLRTIAADRIGSFSAVSKFARTTLQLAATGVGGYLAIRQDLTGGMMIAASITMARGLAPIEVVIGSWTTMVTARDAYRRIEQLLHNAQARTAALQLPRPAGQLTADRLVYAPTGTTKPIIKGVSFDLIAGEALAIIGPTAAGKSTLARLLVGIVQPSSGSVRLDGADIYSWERIDFGKHVGYMPQDVQLFSASVAENVARMGEVDSEAVVVAARLAGAHDLILHLPNGYETQIEEGGIRLSGGQRQRIALARAMYGAPRLLVLDEPNAHLDGQGEIALIRSLGAAKSAGVTAVLITHRPNILQRVDKVLYLRDGQVEHYGPRDEVLARLNRQRASPALVPIVAGERSA